MVPTTAKSGRSFKGAVMYYTHDKKALTSDRVVCSHTMNLATDDTELAAKMMACTHIHQRDIRLPVSALA